ncbi:8005_t:CDS:2, partial [Diversispora eburnea]
RQYAEKFKSKINARYTVGSKVTHSYANNDTPIPRLYKGFLCRTILIKINFSQNMSGIIENESESEYYTTDERDTLSICSNNSADLYHLHLIKQQEAIQELFRSLGFIDINNTFILSGNTVTKAFEQSREKIIKIQQETYSLFDFKSRAKGISNLNITVKLINAISGN